MTGKDEQVFLCFKCGRTFNRKSNCVRHENTCSTKNDNKETDRTVCKKCRQPFSSYSSRLKHEKKCNDDDKRNKSRNFSCNVCKQSFETASQLVAHENETKHNEAGSSKGPKCHKCGIRCDSYKQLYRHRVINHSQTDEVMQTLQTDPWTENNTVPPWDSEDEESQNLKKTYEQHKHLILKQRKTLGKIKTSYNFPVSDQLSVDQMMSHLETIYEDNDYAFKLNISLGIILQHLDTGSLRYFVPYHNKTIFSVPVYVRSRRDLDRIRARLSQLDVTEYARRQRPNTQWKPLMVTNVVYEIYITSYPLGLGQVLPRFITRSKSIISFEKNHATGKLYTDNKCFFRCLAYHQSKKKNCELLTKTLQKQWFRYAKNSHFKSAEISIDQMPDLERCFGVNINVFSLHPDKTVKPVFKSRELQKKDNKPDTMILNLYDNHLSYVTKFLSYASKIECLMCGRLFSRKSKFNAHSKSCDKLSTLKFPGGYYAPPKTIFEKLSEIGITVEKSLQHYPWMIVYDMEAMLLKQNEDQSIWSHEHRPISVCLTSNVSGFEDIKFIFDPEEDNLVEEMIDHMNLISSKAYDLAKQRWQNVFDSFEQLERKWRFECDGNSSDNDVADTCVETNVAEPPSKEFLHAVSKENVYYDYIKRLQTDDEARVQYNDWSDIQDNTDDVDVDGENDRTDEDECDTDMTTKRLMSKLIAKYKAEFDIYCNRVPCIGYNSGKYDINLIRKK